MATTVIQSEAMHSGYATFTAARRLAFRCFAELPRRVPSWSKPAARPFHYSPVRHNGEERPIRTPTQPATREVSTQIPPKRSPHTPKIPFEKQAYEMTFTCKPCNTRSTHQISKQGYHFGSVLITCPECKNKHVISDHLGIFLDKSMTIEDLMRERGQLVKKGTLSEDGSLEFWEDGTTTGRAKASGSKGGVA